MLYHPTDQLSQLNCLELLSAPLIACAGSDRMNLLLSLQRPQFSHSIMGNSKFSLHGQPRALDFLRATPSRDSAIPRKVGVMELFLKEADWLTHAGSPFTTEPNHPNPGHHNKVSFVI